MKISVVIPAYNCQNTIVSTVESVFRQTLAPLEVLVMNDGSTDKTPAILKSFGPRVTVFRQSNGGVASARNALCQHANGDLIAFLDSDDLWHPRYLEAQSKLVQTYPTAVAFFAAHVNFLGDGNYAWDGASAADP